MADSTQLSRKSRRRDVVLELHLPPLPDPPQTLTKIPGVAEWWKEMQIWRQREIEALNRLVNNMQINQTSSADHSQ